MQTALITCQRRALSSIVEDMNDWETTGDATVVLYGYTNKAQDGFILMHWTKPIPHDFQQKQLKEDPDIIDYLIYDLSRLPTAPTAQGE